MRRSRSMILRLVAISTLVSGVSAGSGATDPPKVESPRSSMRVDELIAYALAHNPALAAVEELREEVRGGVVEARADAFPQLDAVAAWNRSRNPSFLNSPDFQDFVPPGFEPSEQEIYDLGVELTQTLYSGGKISAAVDLARVLVDLAEATIEAARLDLARDVAQTYYQLVGARQALAAIELQQLTREENLTTVENRLEIGEATRLEQLQAAAALAEVRPQLEQRRGDAEVLEARLKALLGMDRHHSLAVDEVQAELPETLGLEILLQWAREQRPELHDLSLQIASLELQRTIRQADGRPQVELDGRYGRQARLTDDLADDLFANWSVSLGVRWSFFDGGRRRGEVAQLDSQVRQLTLRLDNLQRQIDVEVEEELRSFQAARARWGASRLAAKAAREASRVASESYNEGVALQLDLLAAQDQQAATELQEVEAYYQALARIAGLARAVGLPVDVLMDRGAGVDPPSAPSKPVNAAPAIEATGQGR